MTLPDALEGFKSESELPAALPRQKSMRWTVAAVGVVLLSASAVVGLRGGTASNASLQIQSEPGGIQVRINGEPRGRTPLALTLASGTYDVVLGDGNSAERRQVVLGDSEKSSLHYVVRENPAAAAAAAPPAAVLSALSVITEPAGGIVSLDGVDRGTAPVVIDNLSAGDHSLVVRNQGAVYQRAVTLQTGVTSTVVIGTSVGPAAAGWLTIQTPLPLQIHEAGGLVGLSETSRLMLTPGDHQLTFSDEKTGFRMTRVVRITPGQTTTLAVDVPRSAVNVNAIPWAEVWVDGARVGETPIGNHMLPLGTHQIELRHPQLGTKRLALTVSLNGPNRVAVNMRDR